MLFESFDVAEKPENTIGLISKSYEIFDLENQLTGFMPLSMRAG
jgi:hypothetical protein